LAPSWGIGPGLIGLKTDLLQLTHKLAFCCWPALISLNKPVAVYLQVCRIIYNLNRPAFRF